MEAIEQRIRPYGSTTAERLRIAILVAVLVVGLLAGFGLGRVGGGSPVAPALACVDGSRTGACAAGLGRAVMRARSLLATLGAVSAFTFGAFAFGAASATSGITTPVTITVFEHSDHDKVIDVGKKGDSTGDILTFHNDVYDGNRHREGWHEPGSVRSREPEGRHVGVLVDDLLGRRPDHRRGALLRHERHGFRRDRRHGALRERTRIHERAIDQRGCRVRANLQPDPVNRSLVFQ